MADEQLESYLQTLPREEHVSKNGKKYDKYEVGTFNVPELLKGKFLMVDRETGKVYHQVAKPLSEEEKQKRKQERFQERKAEWQDQIKINAEANARISSAQKEMTRLKHIIRKKAPKGEDVSSEQDRLGELSVIIESERARKKPVPKRYR